MIEDVMELYGGPLDGAIIEIEGVRELDKPVCVGAVRRQWDNGVFLRPVKKGEPSDVTYTYRLSGKRLVFAA